ncbi:MAG TPA: hypothetical protein VNJ04_08825 [Gemmatimonadaceae bacterium]|nr:hypothetical protein [Gemmatimonadaceae bacterium]
MLNRIFPAQIDNRYRGHPVALWLFVPIAFIKLSQSLTHLLKHDGGAQSPRIYSDVATLANVHRYPVPNDT